MMWYLLEIRVLFQFQLLLIVHIKGAIVVLVPRDWMFVIVSCSTLQCCSVCSIAMYAYCSVVLQCMKYLRILSAITFNTAQFYPWHNTAWVYKYIHCNILLCKKYLGILGYYYFTFKCCSVSTLKIRLYFQHSNVAVFSTLKISSLLFNFQHWKEILEVS